MESATRHAVFNLQSLKKTTPISYQQEGGYAAISQRQHSQHVEMLATVL